MSIIIKAPMIVEKVTNFNGKLNIEFFFISIDNRENSGFYLSGHINMVNKFQLYLIDNSINETQIRIDK